MGRERAVDVPRDKYDRLNPQFRSPLTSKPAEASAEFIIR
jgi:hypothetical protein